MNMPGIHRISIKLQISFYAFHIPRKTIIPFFPFSHLIISDTAYQLTHYFAFCG